MHRLKRKELTIGVCVILTLAILFFGIDYLKGINVFHTANYYFTSFHSVEGLDVSAPVTLDGFKVGLVREMNYDYEHPGNVKVELSLNRQLSLPEGTRAVVVTDLLGTATVNLRLGAGPGMLEKGAEIPGENAAGLMQAVTGDLLPQFTQLVPKVDSLLTSLVALASDPSLRASLQSIERLTANLETSSQLLHSALAPTPRLTADAADAVAEAKVIATNLHAMSDNLAALSLTLRDAPIDSVLGNVEQISLNLRSLTARLDSRDSSLGLLMTDPDLYNNLNSCAAHIDSILLDLKRQPKRYIPSIKIF